MDKKNSLLLLWKMTRRYNRYEKKGASEETLDAVYRMLTIVSYECELDLTKLQILLDKGASLDEIMEIML